MDTQTVTTFFALLAVLAQIAVVTAMGIAVTARIVPSAARARARLVLLIGPDAFTVAAIVALVAMLGSLYLSEVAGFVPCTLCWYQRIAMYPLVVLLGVAAWRRDMGARVPALILASIGGAIAAYHVLTQRGLVSTGGACDPANPCSLIWVDHFGYLTIPTMALSAFALIVALMLVAHVPERDKEK